MAMKPIWMILIGMVLFNGFIFIFSMPGSNFFPQTPTPSATDITHNTTFSSYKTPGMLTPAVMIGSVDLLAIGIGGALAFIARDLKYIICGILVAFISTMWTASATVFSNLMNSLGNPILPLIFTLISVAIGICVALLVFGILTSQEQLT